MNSFQTMRPTWAEVDLSKIGHNLQQFQSILPENTGIMAVVKADGYGHGAVKIASEALKKGAERLAVALPEEGIELREGGINAPILVFGYVAPEIVHLMQEYNLTPTIFDMITVKNFERVLKGCEKKLACHVKIDTGMGRVGVSEEEALNLAKVINSSPVLRLEGIYTHFAAADEEDRSFTLQQLKKFVSIIDRCKKEGLKIPLVHAANSAAAMACPDASFNLVRLGISLYGCYPSAYLKKSKIKLLPALSLKSRIIFLKEVEANTPISYGCTYKTNTCSLIATVPIGYADGFMRSFSNCGQVLVKGKPVPVVGRICMDQMMIDVSGITNVCCGDEVVIYGSQGNNEIRVDEIASTAGTISYELLTAISKRVPRCYV